MHITPFVDLLTSDLLLEYEHYLFHLLCDSTNHHDAPVANCDVVDSNIGSCLLHNAHVPVQLLKLWL
jgi:hypothetical protein